MNKNMLRESITIGVLIFLLAISLLLRGALQDKLQAYLGVSSEKELDKWREYEFGGGRLSVDMLSSISPNKTNGLADKMDGIVVPIWSNTCSQVQINRIRAALIILKESDIGGDVHVVFHGRNLEDMRIQALLVRKAIRDKAEYWHYGTSFEHELEGMFRIRGGQIVSMIVSPKKYTGVINR